MNKQRGGYRHGSGRKRGEPHKTISFRVPVKHSETIHKYLKNLLDAKLNRQTKTDLNNDSRNSAIPINDIGR